MVERGSALRRGFGTFKLRGFQYLGRLASMIGFTWRVYTLKSAHGRAK
jgi:hypothetical protein